MKTENSLKLVFALILVGLFLVIYSSASAAEARAPRTHSRTGTYQSSNGNSGTTQSTVTRSHGETVRSGSATNQDGQTATHASDRTWDKATGTGTVNSASTGFNGATTSRQGTLVKNPDGSVSGQGTLTGPAGKTSTYAQTTTRTDNGATTVGTVTGPNGQVSTVNSSLTKTAPGATSRETTVTGPNGKTTEKEVATKYNPDGTATRVIQVTKPDGTTETRTETFQVATTNPVPKP